jgi:hypothetical protein
MYTLELVDTPLAIVRYPAAAPPTWLMALISTNSHPKGLWSITRTDAELSVICEVARLPKNLPASSSQPSPLQVSSLQASSLQASSSQVLCSQPWRALRVVGQLDFSLTGILASLATPLAAAEISIFALSTFDTDYVLVAEDQLEPACQVLARAGFKLRT